MNRHIETPQDGCHAGCAPLIADTPFRAFILVLLFIVTFAQSPLYMENQNTKFLAGATRAGYGHLGGDWMAGTLDPMPVFTTLVEWVYRYGRPAVFYVLFALVIALYGIVSFKIARKIDMRQRDPVAGAIFIGLFFAANCHYLLGGMDGGIAGQYLLGDYFQPCVMGVMLLVAIFLFLEERPVWAAVSMTAAAVSHPFYVPTSLVLLAVFSIEWLRRRGSVKAVVFSFGIFAAFVVPLGMRYRATFSPTSPDLWRESIHILSVLRIPHHTQVAVFFNHQTIIKLAVMMVALWYARKTRLAWVMAVLLAPIVFFVPYLYFFPNQNLSYTSPWRTSVILFPLCMTFLLTRLSGWLGEKTKQMAIPRQTVKKAVAGLISLATVLGVADHVMRYRAYHHSPESPVIRYAKEHGRKDVTYLVPPRKHRFQSFRLDTGLPVFATWKTHPFKDTEVIEWYGRTQKAEQFYQKANEPGICRLAAELGRDYGVTHAVVVEPQMIDQCDGVKSLYRDGVYRVVRFASNK